MGKSDVPRSSDSIFFSVVAIAFYEEERGLISWLEGVGLVFLLTSIPGVLVAAYLVVSFLWTKFVGKHSHYLAWLIVGMAIVLWLGLVLTDKKVKVWSYSCNWVEVDCSGECTILKYDHHGQVYDVEVNEEFLSWSQAIQDRTMLDGVLLKQAVGPVSSPFGQCKDVESDIIRPIGEYHDERRCIYFDGRRLIRIKKDNRDYGASCLVFL